MHFCSDELAVIVNALQVNPAIYLRWAMAWIRRAGARIRWSY